MDKFPFPRMHSSAHHGNLRVATSNLSDEGMQAETREGSTPLHDAAREGHFRVVESLIKNNHDLNAQDSFGQTPLMVAIKKKHENTAQMLLESGAGVMYSDRFNFTALHYAAEVGLVATVQSLIHKGADLDAECIYGYTPIMHAEVGEQVEVVNRLRESGAHVRRSKNNYNTKLHDYAKKGLQRAVQSLINKKINLDVKNCKGKTALMVAAKAKRKCVIRLLLESGADYKICDYDNNYVLHHFAMNGLLSAVQFITNKESGLNLDVLNANGETALMLAAKNKHREVVDLLIRLNANVKVRDEKYWMTILHYVSENGWCRMTERIVCKKADIDVMNRRGETPILLAASKRHKDVVEMLLRSNADINIGDLMSWTVLHYASKNGWLETVRLIIKKEANIDAKNHHEKTALMLAIEEGHKDVFDLLLQSDANVNICDLLKWTVLHYASKNGRLEEARCIIDRKAEIDAKNREGQTALMVAVEAQHKDIVQLLVELGASLSVRDNRSRTAFAFAVQLKQQFEENKHNYFPVGFAPFFKVPIQSNIVEIITLFLSCGFPLDDSDYMIVRNSPFLKEIIVKNKIQLNS